MDCFQYLGSKVAADGGCERDVVHRLNEGYRAWGMLKSVYEGVIVPTALYRAQTK